MKKQTIRNEVNERTQRVMCYRLGELCEGQAEDEFDV